MKLQVCAIRDAKSSTFGSPMFMISQGTALRSFDDEVNRPDERNMMFHHPEDFAMFLLGTFESTDGVFETHIPMLMMQADQVKKGQQHLDPRISAV